MLVTSTNEQGSSDQSGIDVAAGRVSRAPYFSRFYAKVLGNDRPIPNSLCWLFSSLPFTFADSRLTCGMKFSLLRFHEKSPREEATKEEGREAIAAFMLCPFERKRQRGESSRGRVEASRRYGKIDVVFILLKDIFHSSFPPRFLHPSESSQIHR